MILPHINYCILSWGRDCKDILLLQKKAVRAIYIADYRAHTQPLFKCLIILDVDDIYHLKILVFYHNLLTGKIPLYFHSFMPSVSTGNVRYPLRNPQLQLPKYKHEYIKLTCRYQLPHLLNQYMSRDQEEINNRDEVCFSFFINNASNIPLNGFKKLVKSHFINDYAYSCTIPNCYICELYDPVFPMAV